LTSLVGQALRRGQGARSSRLSLPSLLRLLPVRFLNCACRGPFGGRRRRRSRRPGFTMGRVRAVGCLPTCLVFRPRLLLGPFLPRSAGGGGSLKGLPRTGVRCMPNRQFLSRTQVVVSGVLVSQNGSRGVSGNTPRVLPEKACQRVKVPPASLVPLAVSPTGLALLGLLCWRFWGKKVLPHGMTMCVVKTLTCRLS